MIETELNDKLSAINLSPDPQTSNLVNISIRISDNRAKVRKQIVLWHFLGWRTTAWIEAEISFDLWLKIKAVTNTDSMGFGLKVSEVAYDISTIKILFSVLPSPFEEMITIYVNWFAARFGMLDTQVDKPLSDLINENFTLLPLSSFDPEKQEVVGDVILETELEAVINSVPMEFSLNYGFNGIKEFSLHKSFSIDMKFLHGKSTPSGIDPIYDYTYYEPSESINLNYIGINGNGDKFNYIMQSDSSLTWESRVDTFYNRLNSMGVTLVRLEAFWNKMCPPLTSVNDIDPSLRVSMITDSLIEDYRTNKMDFTDLLYQLEGADSSDITPYVILGVGHKDRPIRYIDPSDSKTKVIAPGTIRGDNPEISESGTDTVYYIGVADSVYLYWLSLYTSAVVREIKSWDKYPAIWQLENELNAARFAESFNWWRKGDSWYDESVDGFQDQVLRTLYNAVVNEYDYREDVKLVQDFHLFNSEKRIREWQHYYDIVGLNFYPNQLHAYPLLGFMTGEFVWAARRILKRMGDQDKPVWLIETGYGSDRLAGEEVPEEFNANTQFYSQERQADYLEDAFRTSRQYGAEAIGWYLMAFREEEGNENNLDEINNYIGLYDKNGIPKKAQYRFAEVSEQIFGSDSVTFANKYNETTIGGYQKLLNTMNSLKSPSILKLGNASDYDVKCDQFVDYIVAVDTTYLQHQNWNEEITEYSLVHNFNIVEDGNEQNAQFEEPQICTFDMNIPNPNESELIKMIEVMDPWLVDASGQQSESFFSLGSVTESDQYPIFKFMDVISGSPYYKIRAPYVVFSSDSIHIFNSWATIGVNLTTDSEASGEPNQKTAFFTEDNSTIQVLYHTNLQTNIGKVYYDGNGVVKIQALEYIADSIAIHRFSEWTTSTPGIVQFGNTNDFHTQLTITGSDARIEAIYENAFELEEDIVLNQNLYIPPGSDYEIPENKKIISNIGYLELDGTRERPIRIKQGGSIFLPKSSSTKYWGGIKVNGGKLTVKNVIIENAEIGIDAIIPSPYVGPYKIQNCTFANNQKAIKYVEPDNQYIFSETAYIDISNCIFYNNYDLDIHMYVEYRAYSCDTVAYNRFYPY